MPDFRTMYDANYIYAFNLGGKDVTLTIARVEAAKVKNADKKEQKKPIVYFKGAQVSKELPYGRGLVLCKTNGKTIAKMYGNNTDEWVGKRITLFSAMVDAFGQTVDAIRIRPTVPKATAKGGELEDAPEVPAPEAPEHAEIREPGEDG